MNSTFPDPMTTSDTGLRRDSHPGDRKPGARRDGIGCRRGRRSADALHAIVRAGWDLAREWKNSRRRFHRG